MANFISYKGFKWEYETYGSGDEMLLAFHGFGNHHSDFMAFEPALGKKYKIISFSLPYHGNSIVHENSEFKTISKDELKELFQVFLHQHRLARFSLMGYSLGGKIVLQLIEFFPDQINTVFLFAADGIRNNWSNGFVTRNKIGKNLYQRIIRDPSRFLGFVKMLKALNLVHEKFYEFLHFSLNTREKRQQVWDVWVYFRDIKPNIAHVQKIINEKKIRMNLFFGKYDRIIPPSIGEGFVKGLADKSCLHIVEMGHVMVREKMNELLRSTVDIQQPAVNR